MAYEQKDMSGALFKNDRREKDTHPNLQGSCLIDGEEYWVSGWTKEGQNGKWISLAFKRKDARASSKNSEPKDTRTHGERKRWSDEDISF